MSSLVMKSDLRMKPSNMQMTLGEAAFPVLNVRPKNWTVLIVICFLAFLLPVVCHSQIKPDIALPPPPPPITVVSTTTSIASGQNPANSGTPVTFTATVLTSAGTAPPGGSVQFYSGYGVTIGSAIPISSLGTATYTTSNLTPGSYSMSAVYSGLDYSTKLVYSYSSSSSLAQTVKATPTISLVASPSSMPIGSLATFAATINGGYSPTGTVTFQVNGSTFGTVNVSGGVATYNGNNEVWPIGNYTISAIYSGDIYNTGASATTGEAVTQATPTVSLIASPSSMPVGSLASLTATINGGYNPTGTVRFQINGGQYNGLSIGTVNVANGSAVYSGTNENWYKGSYTISAIYSGDVNNNSATGTTGETVNGATPILSLVASPSVIPVGGRATFSATLESAYGDPGGTVAFEFNHVLFGTASVAGGVAIYNGYNSTNETWAAGSYTVSAIYSGDDYNNSATATIGQTIEPTADSGTITLTVNGVLSASTNYAGGATPSTIATGLAAGVTGNSPVKVTAINDALFIEAIQPGLASNYPFSLQTTSYDTNDFSAPSFLNPPITGNLQGGTQSSAGSTVDYSYTIPSGGYDGVGNLLSYTDSVMGAWNFSYDSLNRLTGASDGQPGNANVAYCWAYDAFGNRTTQTGSSAPFLAGSPTCQAAATASTSITWANYNTSNQFTNTSQAVSGVVYDAAGNVTNDGVTQYLYDGEGRICAVLNQALAGFGVMTGYVYGADGRRVAKGSISTMSCDPTVNGFTPISDYVLGLAGEHVTEMGLNGNGTMAWSHTNVYASGQLLATYDSNGLHFHLTGPLGTRRAQTDYAGVLEQTFTSLPYGDSLACSGSCQFPTEHHFTGKERDTETQLDYFGARYYASNMGRWMSPDWAGGASPVPYASLANPQTLNLYAYVDNNPVTSIDGDGHNIINGLEQVNVWGGSKSYTSSDYAANTQIASQLGYSDDPTGAQQNTSDDAPRDHFASVSDWPTGAGGFHHTGIAVDSDNTQGFSTADSHTPWWKRLFGAPQGAMENDIEHHTKNGEVAPHNYTHIPITAAQATAIQASIDARTANAGRYNLLFRNCAGAVEGFLHAGGVPGIPHSEVFVPAILHQILLIERPAQ